MVHPGRDRLVGLVEVDESYLGGPEAGGRHTSTKAIVAIAVEMPAHGFGRIRLRHIPDVSGSRLNNFIGDVVIPGALAKTDG